MKKILLILVLSLPFYGLRAQTIDEGRRQLYLEKYGSAFTIFQKLIAADQNNAEAWYGQTIALVEQDERGKAKALLQQAPASVQQMPYYQVSLAAVLLEEGDVTGASVLFNAALDETRQKDEGILAAIAAAHVHAKAGNVEEAISLANKAIKGDKHNAAYYVILGDALLKKRDGSEAYKMYKLAIDQDKNYAAAYDRIGDIFLSQKNPEVYLPWYMDALKADAAYTPTLYRLYTYEFYHDPAKAMAYYQQYVANSDVSIKNKYDLADLLYLNKNYDAAIALSDSIMRVEGQATQPRLYKLVAYSYAAQKDTAKAIRFMENYAAHQVDTGFLAGDFLTMGELYSATTGNDSLAIVYLEKGIGLEKDSTQLTKYYQQLAGLSLKRNDFEGQANWLGKYYTSSTKVNNIDLFNWGLAHYRAGNYAGADSVFGLYAAKYPEQSFGYYWQAKSLALQADTAKKAAAVVAFQKVVDIISQNPADPNYKNWMVDAYSYMAAYEANTENDYAEARDYFKKVLDVDPDNQDAKKYIEVLNKSIANKDSK